MKHVYLLFLICFPLFINAQSIIGQWETRDDETNEKKAVVEIYKTDNRYYAKIVESFVS